jgi:hypothetical protein
MDADALFTKFSRHVAGHAFQRRLDWPHQVIMLDHLLAAVERYGLQAAPSVISGSASFAMRTNE